MSQTRSLRYFSAESGHCCAFAAATAVVMRAGRLMGMLAKVARAEISLGATQDCVLGFAFGLVLG